MPPVYRLYLDESGDHATAGENEIGRRYLGLTGVIVKREDAVTVIDALESFKRTHLEYDPDDPPILHREDIVARRGPFSVLTDRMRSAAFDAGLIELIRSAPIRLVSVVLDKHTHGQKSYRRLRHPYHYCLVAALERYCGLLNHLHAKGDVMAESRARQEDMLLKGLFEEVFEHGRGAYLTGDVCRRTLTSRQLKLKPKRMNVAGLQIADILAHPLKRDVLLSYGRIQDRGGAFADRIAEAAARKYNCQLYNGRIDGYGRVMLA